MSNNKPMCDDTLANKGEEQLQIRATDEQIRAIVDFQNGEYGYCDEEIEVAKIKSNPHYVGLVYTTFDDDEVDEDGDVIEHELQVSVNLCDMKWLVFCDNVLVYTEDLDGDELLDLDWSSIFEAFVGYASESIPTDEQKENEHNPYMDEHRKLVEAIKRNGGTMKL